MKRDPIRMVARCVFGLGAVVLLLTKPIADTTYQTSLITCVQRIGPRPLDRFASSLHACSVQDRLAFEPVLHRRSSPVPSRLTFCNRLDEPRVANGALSVEIVVCRLRPTCDRLTLLTEEHAYGCCHS